MAISKKVAPFFLGIIENGELKIDKLERFKQYLTKLQWKNQPTRVKLSVVKWKFTRSIKQNNYYWGVVIPILANHFGYDIYEYPELHDEIKRIHLGYKKMTSRITGDKFVELSSTAKLDTGEFVDYIDNVRKWALKEFNVDIPLPNEVDFENDAWYNIDNG